MKTKLAVSLSCCALFLGYYFHLRTQPPQKASRAIASVEEGFDFLSSKELELLNDQERRDYLNKISQTIVKASVFKGVFRDRSQAKVSSFDFDLSIGVPKAYAVYHCPMYGLHPFARGSKAECDLLPKAIKISDDALDLFATDLVEKKADRSDGVNVTKCPSGQKMCNPALVGFDFDDAGKASLRCLDEATNANCYKNKSTSGEQISKSLKLLNKANPKYWDEFAKGMEEQCLDSSGKFKESDEGCSFARKQMNYSTRTYRNRLNQKYKDLAAKLTQQSAADAADKKACKQFTKTESEAGLADHENFNTPGFKIMYKRGQCWRVPAKSIVKRTDRHFKVLLAEGDERDAADVAASTTGYDDPLASSDSAVVLVQDIGGLGNDPDRVSDVRFYNFNCGPCNDAVSISACVFNMRKPKADRRHAKIQNNRVTALGTDDCRALIGKLERAKIPDVVFDKLKQEGTSFQDAKSID